MSGIVNDDPAPCSARSAGCAQPASSSAVAEDDEVLCPICKEADFLDAQHSLPCGHSFHAGCIIRWFRTGNTACPLCREGAAPTTSTHRRELFSADESDDGSGVSFEVAMNESDFNLLLRQHLSFGRRKACPREIRQKIDKYRKARENLKERRAELFWHERTGEGRYTDLRRKSARLRSRHSTAQANFYRRAMELLDTELQNPGGE